MAPRSRWTRAVVWLILAFGALTRPLDAQIREGDARDRAEYWRTLDAYPLAEEPPFARQRAFKSLNLHDAPRSSIPLPGGRGRFAPIGQFGVVAANGFFNSAPQADAGRVWSIAVHPTVPNIWWAGTALSGLWKTQDGGLSWSALTDNECSQSIGAIVVDPVNPQIVYAGTGNQTDEQGQACGLLRSTNGGESWTTLSASVLTLSRTAGMHLDPRSAGTTANAALLIANDFGLYRSTNGGESFTRLLTGRHSAVTGHPTNGAVMYAARYGASSLPAALLRSIDGGVTWSNISDTLAVSLAGRIELATSPADPEALWIAVERRSNSRLQGLYRWKADSGLRRLSADGLYTGADRLDFGEQAWWDLALAIDPTNAQRVFLMGLRAYRSENGGSTFSEVGVNAHVDWHHVVVHPRDPRVVLAGSDGGFFVSYDGGRVFEARNSSMNTLQFYPGISAHPTIPGFVLGGTQDNGSMRSGFFSVFEGVTGGDGGFAAINPQDPSVIWTTCQRAAFTGCLYRTSGSTRQTRRSGINTFDRMAFIAPLVMSPDTPTRLYYGTQRLWRTVDEGLNWTARSGDLTRGSGTITAIVEVANAPTHIWVGTSDGKVWNSRDGTVTWRDVSTGLPNRSIAKIAVDAGDPNRAYVAVGGFSTSKVFRTIDGGTTWTDVGSGLPDVPGRSVLLIPGTSRVFFGGDLGVYESLNGEAPWTRTPGLPPARTHDLVYQAPFNLVIAATFGRGLWSMDIGPQVSALRGDINRDGSVNAADALLIQQAMVGTTLPSGLTAFPHGDANCDGTITSVDVLLVLRAAVGAPANGACVGTVR